MTALRNNSGKLAGDRGAERFRASLVTVQIALSMALLIAAGLFIKSLRNISRVDLGIDIEQRRAVRRLAGAQRVRRTSHHGAVRPHRADARGAPRRARRYVVHRCRCSAATTGAGTCRSRDSGKRPDTDDGSRYSNVGPNYFHVLGVPLIAGRDFTAADNAGAARVAIVNEAFAKKFNLGRDAVGKHMSGVQRFSQHRDRGAGQGFEVLAR